MSTEDPKPVEPTGDPRVDALIDALVCPTCRTIYNAEKANCSDPWHSDNRPARDWGEWTPGKGVERIRAEMPGVMPDLTEEDYAAADAVIAAAGGSTVNRELTVVLPKLSDADAAEWAARFREAMRHPQRLIVLPPDEDERGAYARGVNRGFTEAVAALRDGELYDSWLAAQPYDEDLANDEPSRRQLADYLESVGPWEPTEQPEADRG